MDREAGELIPGAKVEEPFRDRLDAVPGLVPFEIDLESGEIIWGDIGNFDLRQPLYDWALRECHSRSGIRSMVRTPLSVLSEDALVRDAIGPTGFIFHMSRCGSSAIVMALAHGEGNLVISEPEPLNQILLFLSRGNLAEQIEESTKLMILRNMISALGRRRCATNERYYLKFSSWNTLLGETICSLFPDVPSIFIYRNPEEVMVSIGRNPTWFSRMRDYPIAESMSGCDRNTLDGISQERYVAAVLSHIIASAIDREGMSYLDYQFVDAGHFPRLLTSLALDPDVSSLEAMCEQFKYDAKDRRSESRFQQDAAAKRAAVTPEIREACEGRLTNLYQRLRGSPKNVV